jgi:hypothetical protein
MGFHRTSCCGLLVSFLLPEIGKNNPKAEQIQTDNEIRMKWNREVDHALVSNVLEEEIRQIKQEYITDKVKMSVKIFGDKTEMLVTLVKYVCECNYFL